MICDVPLFELRVGPEREEQRGPDCRQPDTDKEQTVIVSPRRQLEGRIKEGDMPLPKATVPDTVPNTLAYDRKPKYRDTK